MGKDTEASDASGQAAQAQTELAQQLVGETTPLRKDLISDAAAFVRGGRDVTGLPEFAALKDANEAQFGRARENIIGNTPEGGPLIAALAELETDRASNQVGFTGALSSDEIDRALQLSTFGAAQGSQGLSSAGFIQSNRAAAEAASNAGKAGGLGTAAGTAAAAAILK